MARGRLISRTLGSSRKFASLDGVAGPLREFCQALYPLIVANTDDFGRMAGDAFTVKHAVFPSSPRSEAEFGEALVALYHARMVQLYVDEADRTVLQVVDFETHQPGLSRRTASKFAPPVNFTEIPEIHGSPVNFTPARARGIELKGIELKRTEEDQNKPTPEARRCAHPVEISNAELEGDRVAAALCDRESGTAGGSDDRRQRVESANEGPARAPGLRLPGADDAEPGAGLDRTRDEGGPVADASAAAAGAEAAPTVGPAVARGEAGRVGRGRAAPRSQLLSIDEIMRAVAAGGRREA